MNKRTTALTDTLYDYLLAHSVREPPVLARLREATSRLPDRGMQISPDQGQFMALITRLIAARRCIEIGTFTGYSSLAVALALPPDGSIIACDVNPETTTIAQRFWAEAGVEQKVQLRLQPALQTLDELIAQGSANLFDFAFIDADKESYRAYYDKLLELIRPGGLITVDNTLWDGRVADPRDKDRSTMALRDFNDYVHHDERVDLSLVPIGDGLTLLRKRLLD
jgi:predicted O-methyltransferase YrrM